MGDFEYTWDQPQQESCVPPLENEQGDGYPSLVLDTTTVSTCPVDTTTVSTCPNCGNPKEDSDWCRVCTTQETYHHTDSLSMLTECIKQVSRLESAKTLTMLTTISSRKRVTHRRVGTTRYCANTGCNQPLPDGTTACLQCGIVSDELLEDHESARSAMFSSENHLVQTSVRRSEPLALRKAVPSTVEKKNPQVARHQFVPDTRKEGNMASETLPEQKKKTRDVKRVGTDLLTADAIVLQDQEPSQVPKKVVKRDSIEDVSTKKHVREELEDTSAKKHVLEELEDTFAKKHVLEEFEDTSAKKHALEELEDTSVKKHVLKDTDATQDDSSPKKHASKKRKQSDDTPKKHKQTKKPKKEKQVKKKKKTTASVAVAAEGGEGSGVGGLRLTTPMTDTLFVQSMRVIMARLKAWPSTLVREIHSTAILMWEGYSVIQGATNPKRITPITQLSYIVYLAILNHGIPLFFHEYIENAEPFVLRKHTSYEKALMEDDPNNVEILLYLPVLNLSLDAKDDAMNRFQELRKKFMSSTDPEVQAMCKQSFCTRDNAYRMGQGLLTRLINVLYPRARDPTQAVAVWREAQKVYEITQRAFFDLWVEDDANKRSNVQQLYFVFRMFTQSILSGLRQGYRHKDPKYDNSTLTCMQHILDLVGCPSKRIILTDRKVKDRLKWDQPYDAWMDKNLSV